ncbi:putative gypsy nogag [Trichonephila clavipes]|nr:putative gypsy nogag [Trichonephila clavipes]
MGESNRTLPVVWLGRVNRYPYPRIKCINYGNLNQVTRSKQKRFSPEKGKEANEAEFELTPPSEGGEDDSFIIPAFEGDGGKSLAKVKGVEFKEEVLFLGHRIGSGSRSPSDLKIKAIADFPRPTTKTHVRSFLGLVGYYSHYIPNYSTIASPLDRH